VTRETDSRPLQRWVTGAGVLLIVLMIGADSYEAWQDYDTAILRSEDTQLAIARATSEQTARMVQEIDVVLAEQAQRWGAADSTPAAREAARERLQADVTRFPFGKPASAATHRTFLPRSSGMMSDAAAGIAAAIISASR
jgi:hypothetical protein